MDFILNMLLGSVDAQSLGGDFELARRITEGQEREDPHQHTDRIGLEIFQGPDIHCLRAGGEQSADDLLLSAKHHI